MLETINPIIGIKLLSQGYANEDITLSGQIYTYDLFP